MSDETPLISGLLYKKRGGFGKIMPNPWQFRFFTINKDGIMTYYDTDLPEINISDNKPRGKLDLKESGFEFIRNIPLEGAPTNFTFLLCPPNNEEKWKLCSATKEDFNRWCNIIERFGNEKSNVNYRGSVVYGFNPISIDDADRNSSLNQSISSINSKPTTRPTTRHSSPDINKPINPPTRSKSNNQINVNKTKKRIKVNNKSSFITSDQIESLLVFLIINYSLHNIYQISQSNISIYLSYFYLIVYVIIINYVVMTTIYLRGKRVQQQLDIIENLQENINSNSINSTVSSSVVPLPVSEDVKVVSDNTVETSVTTKSSNSKPISGSTLPQVFTPPMKSPPHTWCRCDHRLFNVRVGPDYNKHKKKAPSAAPIYEAVAVDVFCTKQRIDHASPRFILPDCSNIDTHNKHVPPIFIVQLQMPADPPPSLFTTVEDGPGWAILMYFKITEDSCNQLKDLSNASPAIKLFAKYCEKSVDDAAWRARFKVIASCLNIEELGVPSMITAYNAKPVLIRRTQTIFRGTNYIEMNIHVHKFANLAKQSIHLLSSRCGLMYMQIGFVIEGRENDELPETLFGCVAINKPQEDLAEFLFDD